MIDTAQPEGRGKGCLYGRRGRKRDTYNTERGVRFTKVDLSFFLNKRDGECHSIARTLSLCPCFSSFCSKTSIPAGQHCKQVLTHLPAPCSLPLTCPAGGLSDLWAAILSLAGWVGLNKFLIPSASPAEWGHNIYPTCYSNIFWHLSCCFLGNTVVERETFADLWNMSSMAYVLLTPWFSSFFSLLRSTLQTDLSVLKSPSASSSILEKAHTPLLFGLSQLRCPGNKFYRNWSCAYSLAE